MIINMYTKIEIPENNSLKSKIEELYEWCDKRDNDDELGKTYFNEPIDEDKLNKWEEANGVKIPETYKEWLRFTEKCLIDGRTERDGDDLEFRFCSKCNGNYEYCNEHLFTHEHVK